MAKLSGTTVFANLRLPLALDDCTLYALPPVRITSLAPFPGQTASLRAHLGGFPEAGEVLSTGRARLVWAGRDLVFAFGDGLTDGLGAYCALTDQSDGWCGLGLNGKGAAALLGRRLPFDIRNMPAPGAARSLLEHVPVLVVRSGVEDFEIWVWRSMAQSALHVLAPT